MRKQMSRFMVLLLVWLVAVPGFAGTSSANGSADHLMTQAKTAPPPDEVSLFTIFDPSFQYLENGSGSISYPSSNLKVNISGDTYAVGRVDKVGVQLTLQRWTGSAWIDVYTGSQKEESDVSYTYNSHTGITVEAGYYYRTKSHHWIKQGTTVEEGYRYTSSLLIPTS